MADSDKFDGGIVDGVHQRQIFLTRNAENIFDSFFYQTFHKKISSISLRFFHNRILLYQFAAIMCQTYFYKHKIYN